MNFLLKLKSNIYQLMKQKKNFHVNKKTVIRPSELIQFKSTPTNSSALLITTKEESLIINSIKDETLKRNRNNITRTNAYLQFYLRNPEVHWAFLAHLVSRNGGYYMTDIKSSYLDDLIPKELHQDYFLFLERSNAYIFHDAFPQLLLYEISKKKNRSLFHLLTRFSVSNFMVPIWDYFYKNKSSSLITTAMIINEQNMLEVRVLKSHQHSKSPLNDFLYKLQEKLGFTSVIFPFTRGKNKPYRLCGVFVHDFSDVNERILTGKKLYQILFNSKDILQDCFLYAKNNNHTGSRSDYWNWLFTNSPEDQDSKLYSPKLTDVWPLMDNQFIKRTDWFYENKTHSFEQLLQLPEVSNFDITFQVLKNYPLLNTVDSIQKHFSK